MADTQHDGPWTEEQILAAVAAKSTATPWSAHNGALKHFRDNDNPPATDRIFTTDEWVQQVVHGVRQSYTFGD